MEDILKIIFYIALTLCLMAGAVYFTTGTYFMTKDMEKSLSNPDILNNINKTIASHQKGLLASHPYAWSFTLAILIFLSVILGYYGGLSSCCDPISIFFTILPLSASVILLGALGFLIISIVTGLSAFKGLIDTTDAHIDAGLIRR